MKRIWFFAGCILFLIACNQHTTSENIVDSVNHEEAVQLSLNNGSKWKADTATNQRVQELKVIVENFKIKPSPALNDFTSLGNDVNSTLQKMIKGCTMTGADHEALHLWLEPLLKESKALQSTKDVDSARENFNFIDAQINDYQTYFE